ncbi:MAG: hypothetical protein WC333_09000, partial [Dehalococcoidia bacterium]
ASRQAAISRERKRKKKSQSSEKRAESSGVAASAGETAVASSIVSSDIVEKPARSTSVKPSQSAQQDENRFQYVVRDIRKIAIIAVPLVLILIVLAFVL